MDAQKMEKIMQEIAKDHGVSVEEVRRELELAIQAARANPDPQVQAQWANIPCKGDIPTPEELIAHLGKTVKDRIQ